MRTPARRFVPPEWSRAQDAVRAGRGFSLSAANGAARRPPRRCLLRPGGLHENRPMARVLFLAFAGVAAVVEEGVGAVGPAVRAADDEGGAVAVTTRALPAEVAVIGAQEEVVEDVLAHVGA